MTAEEMLESIRASIEGYPHAGGDIRVMAAIDKLIKRELAAVKDEREALRTLLGHALIRLDTTQLAGLADHIKLFLEGYEAEE